MRFEYKNEYDNPVYEYPDPAIARVLDTKRTGPVPPDFNKGAGTLSADETAAMLKGWRARQARKQQQNRAAKKTRWSVHTPAIKRYGLI